MPNIVLEVLDRQFTIHRFPPHAVVPAIVHDGTFFWIGKTDEELSLVCDASVELAGSEQSAGWSCFKVRGPIDFSVTGVLAGLSAVLATAEISIFALSTFDTDYLLVSTQRLDEARKALRAGGYPIES